MKKKKYRIGNIQLIIMVLIALAFDAVEAILLFFGVGVVANRVITVLEYFIFGIWFWFNGVTLAKIKVGKFAKVSKGATGTSQALSKAGAKATAVNLSKLLWTGGSLIAEMTPIVGGLPIFTLAVVRTAFLSRVEDIIGISIADVQNIGQNASRTLKRIGNNQSNIDTFDGTRRKSRARIAREIREQDELAPAS